MHRYILTLGLEAWDTHIGIRADEMRRVSKIRARGSSSESKDETMQMPLADAGIVVADVGAFWAAQPFDLRLPNNNGRTMHGNCDLCFLKGAGQVLSLIREEPSRADWWIAQEARVQASTKATGDGARFRNDRPSYAQMQRMALDNGELFGFDEPIEDCACTD